MRGNLHHANDSHPQCLACGGTFNSLGTFISHAPCEGEEKELDEGEGEVGMVASAGEQYLLD